MEDSSDGDSSLSVLEEYRELERAGEEAALAALAQMINNRRYSDLILVCKNGVEKYGSRLWLSARCAELERHIANESTVTEAGHTVVSLPATGPAAMLIVLEYLHTGSSESILRLLRPRTVKIISRDVLRAARQLRLPRLEKLIWSILRTDVSRLNPENIQEDSGIERELIFGALSRMLETPGYSDVLIESREGVLTPASRLWLEARCPVLGRMFMTRRETRRSNAVIEKISLNVSTEVIYILLNYLYTGSSRSYSQIPEERKRWVTGLEGICAARYLDIPQLEKILWSSLFMEVSRSISTLEPIDVELTMFRLSELRDFAFGFLSGRIENPVEHDRNVQMLAADLVQIIDLVWMDTDCIKHLTREDFVYFLIKTRRGSSGGQVPYRLEEYLRVRNIIIWCVWEQRSRIYPSADIVLQLISGFFSKAEFAEPLHHAECSDREREESYRLLVRQRRRIARARTTRRILTMVCTIAKFEESFLPFVNLELIHPDILINLLHPWRLIPASVIQDALQKQPLYL
ncbi:hypothetical protein R1flu_000484 [Riccia fluitans]|uniref:BTB domain-containing protein n=1 Tax=Riccia fluitans TaxID=41844 RepID=A0ABD1Y0K0_9MARC